MTETASIDATTLPAAALEAAAEFYRDIVPQVREADRGNRAILFARAEYTHAAWRLAAIQSLARELAPDRVNGVVIDITETGWAGARELLDYLALAPGITGQIFETGAIGD